MPIPKPRKGEKKQKFISRCIRFLVKEGRSQKQASAICYTTWRKK